MMDEREKEALRVLHIGKYYPPYPGGMETFLGDLLPALERRGIHTTAVVHEHKYEKPKTGSNRINGKIYSVPCYGRWLYTPVSPGFPLALKRSIHDFKPHILHLHLPNISAFWVLVIPWASHVPWVIQWQSDVVRSVVDRRLALAYRFYRPFERRLLQRAAVVVASSEPYLETSETLYPWRRKCRTISLGIDGNRLKRPDTSGLRWAEEETWLPGKTRILSIGRLTYYKGHEVLIRAAARMPDAHVLIVGQGDRERALKREISRLGLNGRVTLLGFVPDRNIQALLSTCDIFCLPSIERTEAFGLVILEAMAYGKPVVAADVTGSGMGWIIRHEKTGVLVPPRDPAALADALLSLAHDSGLRRLLSREALKRFEDWFQIDEVAEKIHDLYRDVLSCRDQSDQGTPGSRRP